MKIDGCVPCYNNESTIASAVQSLRAQTVQLNAVFVIDDGSTDASATVALDSGANVIQFETNRGRGAARAAAVEATQADLLTSVDATGKIAADFVELALPWFEDAGIAAVYGRITQGAGRDAAGRWRARHLYIGSERERAALSDTLVTWAFVARPSALREVGNFNATLRHSEDRELGERLLKAGWRIVYEPRALMTTTGSNSVAGVLERYWRWHAGVCPRFRASSHIRLLIYTLKVLVARDLAARDLPCALVSLFLPHYCAFRTLTAGKER